MRKNNPIHVDAAYLAWLSQQKGMVTLSPKADGVYSEIRVGRCILVGELVTINGCDIHLIFDTPSYPIKHKDNLVNRMKWIRNMHPIAKKLETDAGVCASSSNEFIDLCKQDTELLKEYLHDCQNDKIKWYPKMITTSNMNHDVFLKFLDINIDEHLLYKTDGWIITSLKKNCADIAKYKPKDELTIDLLFDGFWKTSEGDIINNIVNKNGYDINNGEIWRCEMDNSFETNELWIPKDLRKDKKIPNQKWIVDMLDNLHKNYWSATNLIPFIKPYYYDHVHKKLDNETINYLNLQKSIFESNIRLILSDNIRSVFDIGCGKGKLVEIIKKYSMEGRVNFKDMYIVGIDIDANNIVIARQKYKYDNCGFYLASMNMDDNQNNVYHNWLDHDTKYDLIVLNNTIQNSDNLEKFISNVSNLINENGYIYIHFIDYSDIINATINDIISVECINDRLFKFRYPWTNVQLEEKLVYGKELEDTLVKYGYTKVCLHNNDYDCPVKFKEFQKCNKFIVYQYKHKDNTIINNNGKKKE